MNGDTTYIPSITLPGDTELIRERAFTQWMSRDLRQAATDFCKNIGLSSIYSAVWISPDHYETAKSILSTYGITPAARKSVD